ncbi:hypothetical protein BDM02DRAFT_2496091 [Thelephora ganbajun]|uniref:Uncharacterized protein n=1 Tax=Thelephora ganbajun TaxID=370292 RepID=A0ACB6ZDX5_THEGA|nr:hypothetical protein BDM02DRAFT_2496091 [Thelephora ganbajun]
MGLPRWIAISSFHSNASRSSKVGKMNAAVREGHGPIANKYQNKYPKGRNNRAPRLGTIAIFVILTPLAQGVKNCAKRACVGSFHFGTRSKEPQLQVPAQARLRLPGRKT